MQVTIDSAAVRKTFQELPGASVRRMNRLIETSAIDVQREMRMKVNVGATGELRRSIEYRMHPTRMSAEIGTKLARGRFLEDGTRPHWTSAKPGTDLYRWAIHKGISPYAVQRSIARKGTKAHPFVKPTFQKMGPRVERDIVGGFSRFIEEVNNGSI